MFTFRLGVAEHFLTDILPSYHLHHHHHNTVLSHHQWADACRQSNSGILPGGWSTIIPSSSLKPSPPPPLNGTDHRQWADVCHPGNSRTLLGRVFSDVPTSTSLDLGRGSATVWSPTSRAESDGVEQIAWFIFVKRRWRTTAIRSLQHSHANVV